MKILGQKGEIDIVDNTMFTHWYFKGLQYTECLSWKGSTVLSRKAGIKETPVDLQLALIRSQSSPCYAD